MQVRAPRSLLIFKRETGGPIPARSLRRASGTLESAPSVDWQTATEGPAAETIGSVVPSEGDSALRSHTARLHEVALLRHKAQSLEAEAYAVAFASIDKSDKPFGVVGIFRPSYVFPFCRAFGDALGRNQLTHVVLADQRGKLGGR